MDINQINQWALDQSIAEAGQVFTYAGIEYRGLFDQNSQLSSITSHGREKPVSMYNLVISKTHLPSGIPFHGMVVFEGNEYRAQNTIEEDVISYTYIIRRS